MLASVVLQELHDVAPKGRFTLGWAMDRLHKQSFGLILLLLAIVAAAPRFCLVAGLLLMTSAFQMIVGRSAPFFPRSIADRPLPTRHLGIVVTRAIAVLRFLEETIHPR